MKLALSVFALSLALAGNSFAQSIPPSTSTPAPVTSPAGTAGMTLSDEQAKTWLKRALYSSDAKNIGEIEAISRDASGKVNEIHADIGGFLGLGQTRVRVMPTQIKLEGDRAVLNMTAEQARALPKVTQ